MTKADREERGERMRRRKPMQDFIDGVPVLPADGVITVLALDISSTKIGIALMDGREVREVFTYTLLGALYQRIEQCADWVRVLPMLSVDALAIEGAAYGAKPLAMIAQQRIVGIILGEWFTRRAAAELSAPLLEIPPLTAKVALTGNSKATKDIMIACARYLTAVAIDEHGADAIAVGLAATGKLEQAQQVQAYNEALRAVGATIL
jgi:Holliday junction resolvasome RuvABC endonuclease subunit